MSALEDRAGRALRLIASFGWADEDPTVLRELLEDAVRLADAVVRDEAASPQTRAAAEAFLVRVSEDTFGG